MRKTLAWCKTWERENVTQPRNLSNTMENPTNQKAGKKMSEARGMLRVTEPRGQRQRFKIEGRQGRYEGLTVWQTKQCGPECKFFREASLTSVFGVCTKGVAWKVIRKNRARRNLRACQVNRVDYRT